MKREICTHCGRRAANPMSFLCARCAVILAAWWANAANEVTR